MVGAVTGFLVVGVIAFGAATQRFEEEKGQPLILRSLHFFSIGFAIGVAALVARYVDSFFAWPLSAFLSTTVYLLVVGAESTAAYLWDHRKDTSISSVGNREMKVPSSPGYRWAVEAINSIVGTAGRPGSAAEYAAVCSLRFCIIVSGSVSPSTPIALSRGLP
jgi:hypothetical protein